MYRAVCVLVLLVPYVVGSDPWDIAVSRPNQLIFYANGTETKTVDLFSQNPTSLVYDEVHNVMLYVDKQNKSDEICGYDLTTNENKGFIKRNGGGRIQGITYDPVTETIFFTDKKERSINSVSLKPGSKGNAYGYIVIQLDNKDIPADIAVDSCKGYVYWTSTTTDNTYTKSERAHFNGSEREVIFRPLQYYESFSLAIDLQTKQMFYLDRCAGCDTKEFYISTANLDRKNAESLLKSSEEVLTQPKILTVSKDYIYFVNRSENYDTVWQLTKNAKFQIDEPKELIKIYGTKILGIIANYRIDEQTKGIQDCQALASLKVKSPITEAVDHTGEPCKASACDNYCLHGECSFNDEGLPKCSCYAGFSGDRCEVEACHGYCLNEGVCSLNEEEKPVCECVGNHKGTRCETDTNTTPSYDLAKRNLTITDLLSILRSSSSKMFLTVEV